MANGENKPVTRDIGNGDQRSQAATDFLNKQTKEEVKTFEPLTKPAETGQEVTRDIGNGDVRSQEATDFLNQQQANKPQVAQEATIGEQPLEATPAPGDIVQKAQEAQKSIDDSLVENGEALIEIDKKQKELGFIPREAGVDLSKKPAEKIETAEDIKKKQLDIKATEDAQVTAEQEKATNEFNQALTAGNLDTVKDLAIKNPDLRGVFNSQVKLALGNKANTDYFKKFSGMSNEQMLASVQNGDIVVGSDQYKLLSPEQRASFDAFQSQDEAVKNTKRTDFETDKSKNVSFTELESESKDLFSFSLRDEYNKLLNSPKRTALNTDLKDLKGKINNVDDELEDLEAAVIKERPDLPASAISAIVNTRAKGLYKKKRELGRQYDNTLGDLKSFQEQAETELGFLKFDDAQNKEIYKTKLEAYETRRQEARADLSAEKRAKSSMAEKAFIEENKRVAADLKFQRDIGTKKFEAELKASNRTGGKYDVDKDGRKIYILNGKSELVEDSYGNVVYSNENEEDGYKDTVNFKDGIYYTQRSYKDGTIDNFVSDAKGDRVGQSLSTNRFIADEEGYRDKAYQDIAGVWTIGYGFTAIDGEPVKKGDTISKMTADTELSKQVGEYTTYQDYITVPLSEEQQTSLNSFEYNLGKGIWNSTGSTIIDAINDGDLNKASKIMEAHNNARSPETGELKESKGLTDRRKRESELLKVKPKVVDKFSTFSQSAQDWATNVSKGTATLSNVPNDIRTEVSSALSNIDITLDPNNPIIEGLKTQFNIVDSIVDFPVGGTSFFGNDTDNESLLEDISGARQASFFDSVITGEKGQMLSKIQFLLDEQPLNKLIEVKAQGATFGALSNAELALLTKSASLLNSAAVRNEEGELGGFKLSEADLKSNLRTLKDLYKKSIETKTGIKSLDLNDITNGLKQTVGVGVQDLSSSLDF